MEISMGTTVNLKSKDGFEFPVYVAQPTGKPKAALVVLQEIFGVNSHIKAVTDGYAADGYLAVAPATFHRTRQGVDLGYAAPDMDAGRALKAAIEALPAPGVMADIQTAIDYACKASGGAKVGILGYCWGGLLAWRAACQLDGLAAAAPFYGGGMTGPEEAARTPRCPVMAHFGEKDHWIPVDAVRAFEKAQASAGVLVFVYAADHGFNCDQRGSYDAPAAKLARERTLAFFAKHLG
jgi:carboxymethylenebutenolidase